MTRAFVTVDQVRPLVEGRVRPILAVSNPAPKKPERLTRFTAAQLQLMTFPPVRYLVPGYITEGLTLLAGKPKLGKSWLALQFCIGVATGGFAFGDQRCDQGDVLYAALEDNPRRLCSRMNKACLGEEWPKRLTFWTDMPTVEDGGIDALREWIASVPEPRMIVIDVLNKVRSPRSGGEDAYAYDYRSITPLKDLADEFGIALVVIHHTRKMAADDQLEVVSGTNGLTGAADTILVLNRGSDGATLFGKGRDIEEIDKAVEFDKDVCRWRMIGDMAEVRRSDERTEILAALREEGAPMSPRDVTDVTGQSYTAIRQTLVRMAKAGEVVKAGRGKYAHPDLTPCHNGHNVTKDGGEEDEG